MPLSKAFDQLQRGDAFLTGARTITEADIVAFAEQTGDSHPQHVDPEWAAASAFGERIAHGMLTLAYTVGLVPLPEYAVAFRRMSDVVFTRPVKIGDTIRAKVRVNGLTVIDDKTGIVGLTIHALNQEDRIVCRARLEAQWRRNADQEES